MAGLVEGDFACVIWMAIYQLLRTWSRQDMVGLSSSSLWVVMALVQAWRSRAESRLVPFLSTACIGHPATRRFLSALQVQRLTSLQNAPVDLKSSGHVRSTRCIRVMCGCHQKVRPFSKQSDSKIR